MPLLAVVAAGCGLLPLGESAETIESSGDRVVMNGVANDPVGAVEIAGSVTSPLGEFVVEMYDSELGPCYDLAFPDGRSEAPCLRSSGVRPERPVTGTPDGSIEGINGGALDIGIDQPDAGIGMLHHGLAHPSVAVVTIEPADEDGIAIGGFPLVTSAEVPGLQMFLAWSPLGVDEYVLAGYDEDGCLVDADHVSLTDRHEQPPGGAGRDCDVRLPQVLRDPPVTGP